MSPKRSTIILCIIYKTDAIEKKIRLISIKELFDMYNLRGYCRFKTKKKTAKKKFQTQTQKQTKNRMGIYHEH